MRRDWKLTQSPWEQLRMKRGLGWTTAVNHVFLVFCPIQKASQFAYANRSHSCSSSQGCFEKGDNDYRAEMSMQCTQKLLPFNFFNP